VIKDKREKQVSKDQKDHVDLMEKTVNEDHKDQPDP